MHEGDAAEGGPQVGDARAPEQGPEGVEGEELRVRVLRDARGERDEGPHEGDETADHQRTAPVLGEVALRLDQVLGLEESRVIGEEPPTETGAEPVSDLRADEGGHEDQGDERRKVESEAIVQKTRGEEERVAGKDGEEHPRLDEDDRESAPQHPRAHREEQALRIVEPSDEGLKPRCVGGHRGEGLEEQSVSLICVHVRPPHYPP